MFTRRGLLAIGVAAPIVAPVLPPAAAMAADAPTANTTPPNLAELMRDPVVIDTALSPDGARFAVLREERRDDKRMAYILLKGFDEDKPPQRVFLGDFDVYQVEWANNDRLLFWVKFTKGANGQQTGLWYDGEFLPIPVLRVGSVDTNGDNLVILFANQKSAMRNDFDLATVVDYMQDDPRAILMQIWDYGAGAWALHKVDVYTGEAVLVERGVGATDGWYTQNGVPMLRWDSNDSGTVVTVMTRAPGEKAWKPFRKFRRNELKKLDDFNVVAPTPEAGVLLVSNRLPGEDTVRVRTFDVRTMEYGKVVAEKEGHDILGAYWDENQALVGVSYMEDRKNYVFNDTTFAPHFRGLNTFFRNECNVSLHDVNLDHSRFILHVSGPRLPGAFYTYDRTIHDLQPIGDQRPWLNEERLAPMEARKVKTRDGAEIAAYLTTPIGAGSGPLPLVVMPHGGPHGIRDNIDYDLFVQYMASRGWLVLQPNYRGSGGYGRAFEDQGRRHWADRMQEDVEDAVAEVVAAGRADPKRIAIWGWSYGAYAALMQSVLRPDLYKAAVSIAGDADMFELLNFARHEDGADSPNYAFWLASVGDPKADADMLRKASPAMRAAEIKAPVFLAHGSKDQIVTPKQSKIMARALKEAGKVYDYTEYKGEGHSGWSDENLTSVLQKSADFIARYI